MRPAIIEPAITHFVAETRAAIDAVEQAEAREKAFEIRFTESRSEARARRFELGALLRKARAALPPRGSKQDGWGAYLEAIGMPETTARRYMGEVDTVTNRPDRQSADLADSEAAHDSASPRDEDAPPEQDHAVERDEDGAVSTAAPAKPDRNTWCTPEWIADAIGDWDLDPCSNDRSFIHAAREFRQERSEDGLFLASSVDASARVFINPPYARGQVEKWVRAYAHVRFCFLLKLDPSTKWFAELIENTSLILIPKGTRVEFVPPVGVSDDESGANPFPHALFYAHAEDATPAIRERCCPPWEIR